MPQCLWQQGSLRLLRSCGLCGRTLALWVSLGCGEGDRLSGFLKHLGSGRRQAPGVSRDFGEGDRVPECLGLLRSPQLPGCPVLWGWRPACQEGGRLQRCPQLVGCPWSPAHLGLSWRSPLPEVLQACGGRGRQREDLWTPGLPQGWGCPAPPGCPCPRGKVWALAAPQACWEGDGLLRCPQLLALPWLWAPVDQ